MDPLPHKITPRPITFTGFPARSFFYSNLRIQETLAKIRYGVEARKGLILLTGETGVGKTALLEEVISGFDEKILCIVESDPRVTFADVLRLILCNFNAEGADEDEATMVRNCRALLRSRLERFQNTALVFDNAHHLKDQTVRPILQNFLSFGPAGPDSNLLQIVLAGRPHFRINLSKAIPIPARLSPPFVCELQPFTDQEIGAYIEQGLLANDLSPAIFDSRSVKRIALYARGSLRLVNDICDRALRISGGPAGRAITPDLIDDAAKDLNISQSARAEDENSTTDSAEIDFALPAEGDDPFRSPFAAADTTEVVGQTFLNFAKNEGRGRWFAPAVRRIRVAAALILFLLGVMAAWPHTEITRNYIAEWARSFAEVAQSRDTVFTEAPPEVAPLPGPLNEAETAAASPRAEDSLALKGDHVNGDQPASVLPNAKVEEAVEPAFSAAHNDQSAGDPEPPPKASPPANQDHPALAQEKSQLKKKELALQITKAIEKRAIAGVRVAIVGPDIAYLDGRVATLRQKRAAERAARGISEVRDVRNRIVVE